MDQVNVLADEQQDDEQSFAEEAPTAEEKRESRIRRAIRQLGFFQSKLSDELTDEQKAAATLLADKVPAAESRLPKAWAELAKTIGPAEIVRRLRFLEEQSGLHKLTDSDRTDPKRAALLDEIDDLEKTIGPRAHQARTLLRAGTEKSRMDRRGLIHQCENARKELSEVRKKLEASLRALAAIEKNPPRFITAQERRDALAGIAPLPDVADEYNEDFEKAEKKVADNRANIERLESQIANLQEQIAQIERERELLIPA